MSEKRILIPWEEIDDQTKRDMGYVRCDAYPEGKLATYEMIERRCTRPITPDDIRSCLRMPDEWTGEDWEDFDSSPGGDRSVQKLTKAIDIALRPAPEPDPWKEMDKAIRQRSGWGDKELPMVWDALKKAEGK